MKGVLDNQEIQNGYVQKANIPVNKLIGLCTNPTSLLTDDRLFILKIILESLVLPLTFVEDKECRAGCFIMNLAVR